MTDTKEAMDFADQIAYLKRLGEPPKFSVLHNWERCIRSLVFEIEALKRGEFICSRCGIRKDGEKNEPDF